MKINHKEQQELVFKFCYSAISFIKSYFKNCCSLAFSCKITSEQQKTAILLNYNNNLKVGTDSKR